MCYPPALAAREEPFYKNVRLKKCHKLKKMLRTCIFEAEERRNLIFWILHNGHVQIVLGNFWRFEQLFSISTSNFGQLLLFWATFEQLLSKLKVFSTFELTNGLRSSKHCW